MPRPSFTLLLSGIFVAYILHSMWTLANLFVPPACPPGEHCIPYYLRANPKLQLAVFTSVKIRPTSNSDIDFVGTLEDFDIKSKFERDFTLDIPTETRRNGTLFLHLFLLPRSKRVLQWNDASEAKDRVYTRVPMTQYLVPASATYQLLTGSISERKIRPVTHIKSQVYMNILTSITSFPQRGIPAELQPLLSLSSRGEFLPIVHYDILNDRIRNLKEVDRNMSSIEMKLTYTPISIGRLRLMLHVNSAFKSLRRFGFSDKDLDEVKGIFADTNIYLLFATIFISSMHLLFDFLALKNDVSFWRSRRTLEGLSGRTVIWRAFSQVVIFLYLLDEETSLLVLGPAAISTIIELWKVTKVMPVDWKKLRLKPQRLTAEEQRTREFDAESMRYLSYVLYPLCIGAAVYSLVYESHRSWYSWCIHSLVNGVYAFGFLFMLPQLFINYRLKSVAHLPWRSFMYKAFNTFIDDVFAFIITMPTAHRLACFRDDFVFLIYLYQRWLYPVDRSRLDEAATVEGDLSLTSDDEKKTN